MEYQRVIKTGIHMFAGKIGITLIGILQMMILARILTTDQMGVYSLFNMVVNLALIVGFNWSDSSIVRHGREEYTKTGKVNTSFWARMYLFIPIMIFIAVFFLVFRARITSYIGLPQSMIFLVISMFSLNSILNFIYYLLQSTDNMKRSAYVLTVQKAIYLMMLAYLFYMNFSTDISLVLILVNLSFLIAILINSVLINKNHITPYTFDKPQFQKIFSYSWPHLIGFLGLYVINYVDLYFINKYLGLHDVGVYSVAYSGFSNITTFIMSFYSVFFPLIVEYKTKGQVDKIQKYFHKIPLFITGWTILVFIGLMASSFVIPLIFSSKYVDAITPFNILLIATIFYLSSNMLLPIVNAYDFVIYSQIFNLIKAAVNALADYILIPKIGIAGAAYGTLITYVLGTTLSYCLVYYKRKEIFAEVKHHETTPTKKSKKLKVELIGTWQKKGKLFHFYNNSIICERSGLTVLIKDNEVEIISDVTGIEKAYTSIIDGKIIISTELEAFSKLEIDKEFEQLSYEIGYVAYPFTLIKNVRKSPPGLKVCIDRDSSAKQPYTYSPSAELDILSRPTTKTTKLIDKNYVLAFREKFLQILKKGHSQNLICSFSGGFDSVLLSKIYEPQIKKYLHFNTEHRSQDAPAISKMEKYSNWKIDEIYLDTDVSKKDLQNYYSSIDEPSRDKAGFADFMIAKAAKNQPWPLMNGQGADKIFCNGKEYFRELFANKIKYPLKKISKSNPFP